MDAKRLRLKHIAVLVMLLVLVGTLLSFFIAPVISDKRTRERLGLPEDAYVTDTGRDPWVYVNEEGKAFFYADKMVGMKDSSIHDFDKAAGLLEKLAKMRGMILVGHKNVATRAELGNLVQLNMPQLTQFPAGYIVAELFADGIRLEFKSAFDLFYDEYSRLRGAAFGQGAERRDKYSLSIWNKFYPVSK